MTSQQDENPAQLSRHSQPGDTSQTTPGKEGDTREESVENEQHFSKVLSIGAIKKMLELLCDESV